jgi:hypothetical protein
LSTEELTDRERAVLDFERDWPAHQDGKLQAITATFGFSSSRYYQLITALIDRPAARRYDPLLISRLHRRRRTRLDQTAAPGLTDQRGRGQRQ